MTNVPLEHWNDVPLASEDRVASRDAIRTHNERMAAVGDKHARIQGILKGLDFPFERAGPEISVLDHLHEEAPYPSSEYAGELLDYLQGLIQAAYRFQVRVMGRLAKLAGDYEASLGVAPIKILIERLAAHSLGR